MDQNVLLFLFLSWVSHPPPCLNISPRNININNNQRNGFNSGTNPSWKDIRCPFSVQSLVAFSFYFTLSHDIICVHDNNSRSISDLIISAWTAWSAIVGNAHIGWHPLHGIICMYCWRWYKRWLYEVNQCDNLRNPPLSSNHPPSSTSIQASRTRLLASSGGT